MKSIFGITLILSAFPGSRGTPSLRSLQEFALASCGVTGFSLYDPTTKNATLIEAISGGGITGYTARIFLEEYKNGRINIFANVGKPCMKGQEIKCVKIVLAGEEHKERAAPYALYGGGPGEIFSRKPNNTGWQTLEAWTYTDKTCTKGESGQLGVDLHIVTKSKANVRVDNLRVAYASTKWPASEKATKVVKNVTCAYLLEGLSGGLIYKQTVSLSDFRCNATQKNRTTPLQVDYNVSVSYTFGNSPGPYDYGHNLPNKTDVRKFLAQVLKGDISIYPNAPDYLEHLKSNLPNDNPYYRATNITLLT